MAKKMVNKKRNNYRYLKDIIEKRYIFLIIIIIILFSIIGIRLFYLQIIKNDLYSEKLLNATSKTIESTSVPRGRIYDRNYNIIVDNQAVKTIYYKKESGITKKEEIELAYKVAALIDIDYSNLTENQIKAFWLINNFELGNKKITEEEWKKYSSRKLTSDDLYDLKLSRVTEEEISRIRKEVEKYPVEGDLRREVNMNIKTKMEINSYEGTRHKKNLPVRGQRTNRNARTRKGKGKVVANKKK